jgi:hypothetical protein
MAPGLDHREDQIASPDGVAGSLDHRPVQRRFRPVHDRRVQEDQLGVEAFLMPVMRLRVVCGFAGDNGNLSPITALKNVDLPHSGGRQWR